ncbi:DNA phosphorothioation-dependent restriction protein DptG [Psychrobacillus sp. OK032]|uniref:DNA phosphorothioation-dependent restriction protein DptG n=1 Tax=Psychrobacillus sp. OK032 TaxID=1884358 RepID=UPI0008B2C2C0|nr:DNA phosphorothioation-dependent restriction protein DptG [Psychrobacillus sp. OK032]SES25523.1 DNA phosphorothioation-dependent restriction protein DptG [Psychrobacillus sp. OK032]
MEYKLDYEKINKFVDKKGKYTYRRRSVANVLPLPTREPERAKFDKGFISVVGGVIRTINGKNLRLDLSDTAIDEVVKLGNYKSDESAALFTYYLKEQLRELNNGKVSSFKQLEQVPFAEDSSEQKGEIDFVSFFYDTFIGSEKERVKEILKNIDNPNLIAEILDHLSLDAEMEKSHSNESYKTFFHSLRAQFLKDLEVLSQNQSFLLEHVTGLFVHYTFVAISQMILQTNKTTNFNEEQLTPVYYILQWEKAARWRNCYKHGYKMLVGEMEGFFAHEHALNIVGLNTFSNERNIFYHNIKDILLEAGSEAEKQFVMSIYTWLNEFYTVKTGIQVESYTPDKTIDHAFADLLSAIRPGISKEINSRYQKAFEAIVTKFFRKHGGSLGTLLSLTQEQLLLLVAVSVGNERIELKQLWIEIENRGIWLDHHSKEEVVKVLDKLNYMEKKSDSGDAQYVKSIL